MTVHEQLLRYWSNKIATDIVKKTIVALIEQTELIEGEERCLENNWEEYCISVKYGALSPRADEMHENNIEHLFGIYYQELPKEEKYTLWLESDEGQDWYWENNNRFDEKFELLDDPCFISNYTKILMHKLHLQAQAYESDNIRNYVDYHCNGIEIDDKLIDMVIINIGDQAGSWEDVTADVYETADVLGISVANVNTVIGNLPDIFDDYDGDRKVSFSPQGWEYYLELKENYE